MNSNQLSTSGQYCANRAVTISHRFLAIPSRLPRGLRPGGSRRGRPEASLGPPPRTASDTSVRAGWTNFNFNANTVTAKDSEMAETLNRQARKIGALMGTLQSETLSAVTMSLSES